MPWEETDEHIRSGHRDPDEFQADSLRTIALSEEEGIKAIIGRPKGQTTTEVQSYLFDKSKDWTLEKAKAWFKTHESKAKESFSWAGSIKQMPGVSNLIRGEALHPIRTVHPDEWPEVREYLEEELQKSTHTLTGKPLLLDHYRVLRGEVLGAEYEDGAIEYVAKLEDQDVLADIADGKIKHCSVEFEWKSLENVNGVAPRGINFTGLSLLKNFLPGDPLSSVEVWEALIKKLKEAKGLTSPNPPQGSETEKTKMSLEEFKEKLGAYPDYTQQKYLKLLEAKKTVKELTPLLEAEWDTEYINNLDDDCFAYIEPGGEKDEQGKTTPRSLRHFPYKNAEGNLSPDHVRNGLARLGQELGDWATADAKAQIKKKLCAAAKEIEIESEVCGLAERQTERIKLLEEKIDLISEEKTRAEAKIVELENKIKELEEQQGEEPPEAGVPKSSEPLGEAIIPSTVTPPSDLLKEIKQLLPERVPMSWGGHYAQLWRNLRNLVKKYESQSQG